MIRYQVLKRHVRSPVPDSWKPRTEQMHLLEVKNLHVEVEGKAILNGLDLSVGKGSVG